MHISWHNKGIPQECGQNFQKPRYTVYQVPLTIVSGHPMRFCRKVYIPGVPREIFGQSLGFSWWGFSVMSRVFCDFKRKPFLNCWLHQ